MQKKLKFQRFMILILAFLIVVILVSILLGRSSSVEVMMVSKDGLDTTKTLEQQIDFFKPLEVSKADFDKFGGNILLFSDFQTVKTQKPKFSFLKDTPLIKSMLTSELVGGAKAANIGLYHTIQKLTGAVPPGAVAGDRIDIILLYQAEGTKGQKSGILLRNVLLDSVSPDGGYVAVSQSDALKLTIAQGIGTFVLQLPGTKETHECSVEELKNRNTENIECYVQNDDLSQIDTGTIMDELENHQTQVQVTQPTTDLTTK